MKPGDLSAGERPVALERDAPQPGNGYCFQEGDIRVTLRFQESGPSLEEAVRCYVESLRRG